MNILRYDTHHILSCKGQFVYSSKYENSITRRAFDYQDELTFSLRLPRQLGGTNVELLLFSDETKKENRYAFKWKRLLLNEDQYEIKISSIPVGLYYLTCEIKTPVGVVYLQKGLLGECSFTLQKQHPYQLTISDFHYIEPKWIEGGVIYQVFVDRFCSSKKNKVRPGAILNPDWENGMPEYPPYPGAPLKNNVFFGGDLQGLTSKLSYLYNLGVRCLYLCPIFDSVSNHKYDTADYMHIDEMFGGEDAFGDLLQKSKELGIGIILDGVFNHTGDESIYFNHSGSYPSIGAFQSQKSEYYDWYYFKDYPNSYECWWDIPILPKLNLSNPSCIEYFLGENGVINHYAQMGISGFRLDVADELPEKFIEGIKNNLTKVKDDLILYGEVWEDASNKIAYEKRRHYFQGTELDGVMNYELRRGIISYLRNQDIGPLEYALLEVMANAPKRVCDCQMNFIGTHDTIRAITALAGDLPYGYTNEQLSKKHLTKKQRIKGIALLKLAYLMLFTLPGIPMIYYGDEIGMEGYSDPFNRYPYRWRDGDKDLQSFVQTLGELRNKKQIYQDGYFELVTLSQELLIYKRIKDDEVAITIINNSKNSYEFTFPMVEVEDYLGQKFKNILLKEGTGTIVFTDVSNASKLQFRVDN